jgi:CheY-like chemotaxis protein
LPALAAHHCAVAIRVLVVDDSAQFLAAVAELLIERGFEVMGTATCLGQALVIVTGRCPDAVLLDINLTVSDGFTAATALAAACPGTAIVLTSANVGYVSAETLRATGAAAFVRKESLVAADLDQLFTLGGR